MYSNEKMNEYMKSRWMKRRSLAIAHLGGRCVRCGTIDNLEFDHINADSKIMTIAKASSRSDSFFWDEINKCQLLCTSCHKRKTVESKEHLHAGNTKVA